MRAHNSAMVLSLVVVVLALVSGCSPDEPDVVVVGARTPRARARVAPGTSGAGPGAGGESALWRAVSQPRPKRQSSPNSRRPRSDSSSTAPTASRSPCACLATLLVLYPPGYPPNGSLTLPQVPSASGVHYRAADIDFRSKDDVATLEMGRERHVDCVANPAAAVWQETLPPQRDASLTGERRKGMLKRLTVWGAALAAIVVAALLVTRMGPDGAPAVVEVLEQAPLPLPTGPRDDAWTTLQRQIRLPQEPAGGEHALQPPAVASDEPELAAAPDGSRRFMFDCGNGVIFCVRTVARRKRRCSRRKRSAPKSITLPQTEAASGARYAAGDRVFWSRGGRRDVRDPRSAPSPTARRTPALRRRPRRAGAA